MKLISLFIVIYLFLNINLNLISGYISSNPTYYLRASSICQSECGSQDKPFSNFKDAISFLSSLKSNTPLVLLVDKGDYFGEFNQQIKIDFNLEIRTIYDTDETILDCQDISYAFKAVGETKLAINGLIIKNCIASKGGAIYTENKITTLENIKFISNSAQSGAAVYSNAKILDIESCSFISNKGLLSTIEINKSVAKISKSRFVNNNLKDISCYQTTVDTSESYFTSLCISCDINDQDLSPLCNNTKPSFLNTCNMDGICDSFIENNENCPNDCSDQASLCNSNGVCDSPIENYKNCPIDCLADYHPGWRLEMFNYKIMKPNHTYTNYPDPVDVGFLGFPSVIDFMGKSYPPLSGKLSSKISVTETRDYYFKLSVANIAAVAFIDGRVLFDNFQIKSTSIMDMERKLLLSSKRPHFIEVYFTVSNDFQRDLELFWKTSLEGEYTLIPSSYITLEEKIECGDGVCNEEPSTCLIDCHDQFEPECSPTSPAPPLQTAYYPIQDMVGTLLNTQYLSTLPGIKYMSHGIDLQTGKSKPTAIFAHTYCDDTPFSVAHFHYRDAVYTIPHGLNAQISPECTSDSKTTMFSSSYSHAKNQAQAWGVSTSNSVGIKMFKATASYSQSESFNKAQELEQKQDGSLYHSTVVCDVYKVNMMEPYRWNPRFLEDIGSAYFDHEDPTIVKQNTTLKMVQVIQNYGSGFYKSVTLGGKLEQTTSVENSYDKSTSSLDTQRNIDWGFSLSGSGGVFKASAKYHESRDKTTTRDEMEEFIRNSKRTTLTVTGGAPGAYGEDEPNAFETWANSLDKLPAPVEGKIEYVSDILPTNWYFRGGLNVKEIWEDAELLVFKNLYKHSQFKYTDPKDENIEKLIDNLGKDQNMYVLLGKECTIDPSIYSLTMVVQNIASPDGFTLENNPVGMPSSKTHILFGTKLNDDDGVRSIKFIDPRDNSPIQPCNKFKFISLTSTRQYEMEYDISSEKFINKKINPTILTIQFTDFAFYEDIEVSDVELTVLGSNGRVSQRLKHNYNRTLTTFKESMETINYLGDIVGVTFTYVGVIFDQFSFSIGKSYKTDIEFKSILITQSCPDDLQLGCIPNKVIFDPEIGYVKTFEFWRLPRNSLDIYQTQISALKMAYVPIDPFGL